MSLFQSFSSELFTKAFFVIFQSVKYNLISKKTEKKNYKIHIELVDKTRSCRRKLRSDNRYSQGDEISIETMESYFKIYMVDIR